MMKVNIKEKYNTSFGKVIITDTNAFSVGDRISCDDGKEYIIMGIQMPTRPTDDNTISLIVN